MPSAEAVIGALTKPETWPDYASELGRFTPLRPGGLPDQTFEIEVAAGTESGRPFFTRGYVTITTLVTPDDPVALADWFDQLEDGLARYGDNEPRAVPEGATPLVGFDLTIHQGISWAQATTIVFGCVTMALSLVERGAVVLWL